MIKGLVKKSAAVEKMLAELPRPARTCGSCQLCCKLMPVTELEKAGGDRCVHQSRGRGCRVYDRRPRSCFGFFCLWRLDKAGDTMRPDQMGCVIDHSPDFVTLCLRGDISEQFPCAQIWADPERPGCHRHPKLLDWIEQLWQRRRMLALIRYSPFDGARMLIPPELHRRHAQWEEVDSPVAEKREHSKEEREAVIRKYRRSLIIV